MSLGDTTDVFPNNVVVLVHTRLQMLDTDLFIADRPLRPSDPNQCVGVYPQAWVPIEDSYELLGGVSPSSSEATLSRYQVGIQAFIKDMDQERGVRVHSYLSTLVRATLYRDAGLRVGLAALSSTVNGVTERAKRWGVTQQRFLQNEIQGEWLYLSSCDFWLETETV